jgi:hypothetical protein
MNAVPFDTLKFARRLEDAGLSAPAAAGASEALAEALTGAEIATKTDVSSLHAGVRGEIELLRHEMELLRRDLTIRLGGMMVVAVGVILTAIRYLPAHP